MKIKMKHLMYLPIIFFFFPAFTLYIPGLGIYPIFYFVLYTIVFILLITKWQYAISRSKKVIQKTPLKIFLITMLLVTIDSLFLSLVGVTSLSQTIKSLIFRILLCYLPIFLYFICIIDKFINYKKFIQVFTFLLWLVLIIGFIAYIGQLFSIEIINNIFDFFANMRILSHQIFKGVGSDGAASNYIANNLPRLDNLHEEPSFYARFLFLFLPFIFTISNLKIKLFKNNTINLVIKKTIVPFSLISIILTQSPIYLILTLILISFYAQKKIIKFIQKNYIIILLLLIVAIILFLSINLQNTYFYRILSVLQVLSFDEFIIIEPSLASRIINFYNTLQVFLDHPITGVGIANVETYQLDKLLHSKLPLTHEIMSHIKLAISNNSSKVGMNTALFYSFLASHGIIISTFFAYFHIKLYIELNKLSKYDFNVFFYSMIDALKWSWICITVLIFYHTRLMHIELLFLYTLMIITIYKGKKILYYYTKGEINEKNNFNGRFSV